MEKTQIRKCGTADIKAAGEFYDRVVKWLDEHINYPKWVYRVYPSESYAGEMTKAGSQYLCTDGGKITGAFVLNADPMGDYGRVSWSEDLREGEYMIVHAMAVDPCLHGQGMASDMLRFCEEKAREDGYKALRLDVVPDNIPARRLFEKNGFVYAGDADLGRGYDEIPVFSLYELSFK